MELVSGVPATHGVHETAEHDPAEGSHVEDGVVEHPTAEDFGHARALPEDRTWFKRAVFYEVLVRAFYDSNSDGVGDLRGLTEQLDYLKWLGVDCLWLPPFYDSPLRDGGYDIRDFYRVLPEFGTVDDFVELLDAAHRRGIRVITDLVMNHTSDSHEWFQESQAQSRRALRRLLRLERHQRALPGRPHHLRRHRGVELDVSTRCGRQFYWHRFFSHQPDLNYDNPAVQNAMLDVLRFWLDLGIDGFRLDAVPYLFEREGTNCENLPETHAFLKHCRKVIDDEFPGRVLLAEANQWPADVVEYFGDPDTGGDECHMAFHFPLMPRIFMAVRRESRFPISEILANTPAIPDMAQWGIFLRNHDELTLEMVTDEERDYMYAEYAKDPRMKANVGIRRRLAPLLENDRNQMRVVHRAAVVAAGFAGAVLRRRDRHGRHHLARRPRRGAHPDAVDARPQRRLLDRQPRPAVPAAQPGPDLRLPVGERRGAAGQLHLAAELDPHDARRAGPPRRVRHRRVPRAGRLEPVGAHLRARDRGRGPGRYRVVRQQPVAVPAADRAEPAALERLHAGRDDRVTSSSPASASCPTC